MTSFLGRTGADAIYRAIHHVCRLNVSYGDKFRALAAKLYADHVLTSEQYSAVIAFMASLDLLCGALGIIADNSPYSG